MGTPDGFINGVPGTQIPVADRAVAYGHGLFETMRLWRRSVPLWSRHLSRLRRGAEVLGVNFAEQVLTEELTTAVSAFPENGLVKLILTAGDGERGYRYHRAGGDPHTEGVETRRILQFLPLPKPAENTTLQLCEYRLPVNPRLAGIKHLNRLDQVLAAAELPTQVEGLLLDNAGRVVEVLQGNIFVWIEDQWYTPPLEYAGVEGVMRNLLLENILPKIPQAARIAELTLDDLRRAEAAFSCNAVRGVTRLEALHIGGEVWSFPAARQVAEVHQALVEEYPCFAD